MHIFYFRKFIIRALLHFCLFSCLGNAFVRGGNERLLSEASSVRLKDCEQALTEGGYVHPQEYLHAQGILEWGAAQGSLAYIDVALRSGAHLGPREIKGVIEVAAQGGHFHILEWLQKKHGAHLDLKRLLATAGVWGHVALLEWLSQQLDDPMSIYGAINSAIFGNKIGVLQWAADHNIDFNTPYGENNNTALYWAALYGHLEQVTFLLEHGAQDSVKHFNQEGKSPLHILMLGVREIPSCVEFSAEELQRRTNERVNRIIEIATFLLEAGADINAVDHEGKTTLDHALARVGDTKENLRVIDFLRSQGAQPLYVEPAPTVKVEPELYGTAPIVVEQQDWFRAILEIQNNYIHGQPTGNVYRVPGVGSFEEIYMDGSQLSDGFLAIGLKDRRDALVTLMRAGRCTQAFRARMVNTLYDVLKRDPRYWPKPIKDALSLPRGEPYDSILHNTFKLGQEPVAGGVDQHGNVLPNTTMWAWLTNTHVYISFIREYFKLDNTMLTFYGYDAQGQRIPGMLDALAIAMGIQVVVWETDETDQLKEIYRTVEMEEAVQVVHVRFIGRRVERTWVGHFNCLDLQTAGEALCIEGEDIGTSALFKNIDWYRGLGLISEQILETFVEVGWQSVS